NTALTVGKTSLTDSITSPSTSMALCLSATRLCGKECMVLKEQLQHCPHTHTHTHTHTLVLFLNQIVTLKNCMCFGFESFSTGIFSSETARQQYSLCAPKLGKFHI